MEWWQTRRRAVPLTRIPPRQKSEGTWWEFRGEFQYDFWRKKWVAVYTCTCTPNCSAARFMNVSQSVRHLAVGEGL